MAVASVSGETAGALAGELEAVTWLAHGVDVTAVSAGETWILFWQSACQETRTGQHHHHVITSSRLTR